MSTIRYQLEVLTQLAVGALARLRRSDRGEGVVSTAIAVLIMAFLGALMWVGFQTLWADTEARTADQVEQIGR